MKRIAAMLLIVAAIVMVYPGSRAEAAGLLGKNYVGLRGGMFDYGPASETGSFGEIRAQFAIKGNVPVDLYVSHLTAGTDNVDVWIDSFGGNVMIQEVQGARIYGGAVYRFFEYETWAGASDDDTFFGVHLGAEKALNEQIAIDARFALEDSMDGMDPQIYLELLSEFNDRFTGILGYSTWLDSEISLLYAGIAVTF